MKATTRVPLIYHDRPLFGFDLGTRTAKLVQIKPVGKTSRVLGYGFANFPGEAIVEGIVVDPQEIAIALKPLFDTMTFGEISATRVAASIPVAKVFTRILELPPMNMADLGAAVRLEAEQYIPVPLPDLYIDYEIVDTTPDHLDVLMVAAPRAIVDSYLKLFDLMNLEVAFIESSLSAVTRAIIAAGNINKTTLVADIGSESIDITVFDKAIRLTDTIPVGGDHLTTQLVADLAITREQANEIKFKFGLGPSGLQPNIQSALKKPLATITSEFKRVTKYYQDRSHDKHPIDNIIISGGSASMPGLLEYLTAEVGLPIVIADPWAGLELHHIQDVSKFDAPMFTTAIGLARMEGKI